MASPDGVNDGFKVKLDRQLRPVIVATSNTKVQKKEFQRYNQMSNEIIRDMVNSLTEKGGQDIRTMSFNAGEWTRSRAFLIKAHVTVNRFCELCFKDQREEFTKHQQEELKKRSSKLEALDARKEFDDKGTTQVCEFASNFKCLRIADHEDSKFSFLKITPAVESEDIKQVVKAFENGWAKENLIAKPFGFTVYMFAQPQEKYDLFINIDPGDYERLFKIKLSAYEKPIRHYHGKKV